LDALQDETVDQSLLQPESVIEWTRSAQSAKQEWFDSPGVGQDVRIEGEMLIGAALVVEQQPVHLELFRERREIGDGLPRFQHKFRPQKEPAADPVL